MPYIRIITSEIVDRPLYEEISRAIDVDHRHPEGMLMHAAGENDGRWQIVNIWEAREYADQFDREILMPTIRELTGEGDAGREVRGYEVSHFVTP